MGDKKIVDNIPKNIRLAIKKASSCQFCEFINKLSQENKNHFSIKALIGPEKTNVLDCSSTWYRVELLIPRDFPYKKVQVVPIKPKLRWYPHQNGTWENRPNFNSNIICPPSFDEINLEELLLPYIRHAYRWISDALNEKLIFPKQRYEFPHIIPLSNKTINIYIEGGKSIYKWIKTNSYGISYLKGISNSSKKEKYIIKYFISHEDNSITWDSKINDNIFGEEKGEALAPWIYANNPVVDAPHKPPKIWSDLPQGIQHNILSSLVNFSNFKSSMLFPVLLIGFSVPERWGGNPESIVWKTIDLQGFNKNIFKKPKMGGFRRTNIKLWPKVRKFIEENKKLIWLPSCTDISKEALTMRDSSAITKKENKLKIAILGVGALGSILAKGISKIDYDKLLLVDKDKIEPGNLIRHEAFPFNIEQSKAKCMSEMIKPIYKDKVIDYKHLDIIKDWDDLLVELKEIDLIIDTTANFAVHRKLSVSSQLRDKSIIYCYIKPGPDFGVLFARKPNSNISFNEAECYLKGNLSDEILKEFKTNKEDGLIWPEPGCYHPTFNASYHRVRMMVDSFLTVILSWINNEENKNLITLFRQVKNKYGIENIIEEQIINLGEKDE